jgi:hypothetical protein
MCFFKRAGLLLILIFAASGNTRLTSGQVSSSTEIGLYTPLKFILAVDSTLYTNPFDSNDIEMLGVFRSPSGAEKVIPGFWMQPYVNHCIAPCQTEALQPDGEPVWQVRFTPQEIGPWTYTLQLRDNGAVVTEQTGQFAVTASGQAGFIQVGPNRRYFQYENGQPYFPIGHNLNWSWEDGGGLATYRQWLQTLSASGGNYARLFIDVPWFIGLEWERPVGDYRAAQKAAARLDMILEVAAEYGIALQLVLLWHQALNFYVEPPVNIPSTPNRPDTSADWDNNPYSVLNGGPLSGPGVFFFDATARELFRRRLRYIVARWGYSPRVFAWEVVDRIDRTANYNPPTADIWLSDVASYLRQIDQQGHLITVGSQTFDPVLAVNPFLDFTQTQFYQRRPLETVADQVTGSVNVIRRNLQLSSVPTLLTNYSLNPWYEPTLDDPDGIHFQTTLWAAALSGAGGGAASDWGDTYVVPQGLERYYRPLSAFVTGIDWATLNLQPAEASFVASDVSVYGPVRVSSFNRQFRIPPGAPIDLTITADGILPDTTVIPSYLYGKVYDNQLSQPQTYHVALPVNTTLEVRVRAVDIEHSARLLVVVDGQDAAELGLDAASENVSVRVPLTAGEHTVVLDNTGDDWLELDWLQIDQLAGPVRVLSLRDTAAGVALAWLQHRHYTWDEARAGAVRTPVTGQYRLDRMPAGHYRAELWDPFTGVVLGEDFLAVASDGVLRFDLLPMDRMMALRLFREAEFSSVPSTRVVPTIITTATASSTPSVTPTAIATSAPPATDTTFPSATPFLVVTNTPRPTSTQVAP